MHKTKTGQYLDSAGHANTGSTNPTGIRSLRHLLCLSLCIGASAASHATATYDTGNLSFSTTGQSMWDSGPATQLAGSQFVGTQWTNETLTLGGIAGGVETTTVNTNPGWWAWKLCKDTVNIFCGDQPAKWQQTVTIDTRTGAKADLTSSGKFGLEFGYTMDSGSVDAAAQFNATALLPTKNPGSGTYFSLDTASMLNDGALSSQSPTAQAYINAIAELSGSVTGQACLIGAGCTDRAAGTANLPTLAINQPILSIDPNNLNIVPGGNPFDPSQPLAQTNIFNQTVTLEGAISGTPPAPGMKVTTNFGTLASTIPPGPAATFDLASIEFKLPDISTSGGLQGNLLTSSGRDDVIRARIDIDGVATLAGFPPLGIGLDLIDAGGFKIGAKFDVLDIDAGPDIGITQDFELEPTLMARLDFSNPVYVDGLSGLQTFWEGIWADLPDIAMLKTTTVNPTFWVEALLKNTIGIDLGLTGTMDILKFSAGASYNGISIFGTTPISLNSLLGLGNELFSTDKLRFSVYSTPTPFLLGGFNSIQAAAFTIQVPSPGTLAVLSIGLLAAGAARRRRRPQEPSQALAA